MSPPISFDGTDVSGITIDGTDVTEVTVDGSVAWQSSTTPTTPDSVDYQFVGNSYSEGAAWTDELAGATLSELGSPTKQTSDLNGNDTIYLDGVDDAFHDTTPDISYSQPDGIVIVGRHISGTGLSGPFWDATGTRQIFRADNGNGNLFIYAGSNLEGSAGNTNTSWQIYNVLYDGIDSDLRMSGTSVLSGDTGTNGLSEIVIGSEPGLGQFHEMEVAEIWFMGSPSAQDRDDADQYLADKYGITL